MPDSLNPAAGDADTFGAAPIGFEGGSDPTATTTPPPAPAAPPDTSDPANLARAAGSFDSAQADIKKQRQSIADLDPQIKATEGKLASLEQQHVTELEQQQQTLDQYGGRAPQDHIQSVMQQAPLFMALSALAGGFQRSSAVTALGSMNGMMMGILKGDRQQFDDAQTRYTQELQSLQQKWATRDKIYQQLEKSYGDTEEGMLRRWQIANAAIGEDEKTANDSLKYMGELHKLQQQITDKHTEDAETARHNRAEESDKATERRIEQQRADQAGQKDAAKKKDQSDRLQSIDSTVDDIIAQISKAKPGTTTGVGGSFDRLKQAGKNAIGLKSDTTSTDVQAQIDQLNIQLAAYDKAGGHPSAMLLKLVGDITGGKSMLSNDPNTISRLQQLKKMLAGERAHLDSDTPAPTFSSAADVKKAYTAGELDYDAASKILQENGWAK